MLGPTDRKDSSSSSFALGTASNRRSSETIIIDLQKPGDAEEADLVAVTNPKINLPCVTDIILFIGIAVVTFGMVLIVSLHYRSYH